MTRSGPKFFTIFTTAIIITGNMIGAGILALPINLGPAGVLPSVIGALAVWAVMTFCALIIARQPYLAENPHADLPTFFEQVLGKTGKYISVGANLIIFYGLLTAYLAGVMSVVTSWLHPALPEWVLLCIYFAVVTGLASMGEVFLRKGNTYLILTMWTLFLLMLGMVIPHMYKGDVMAADWHFFIGGLPILVVAFNFHNIVPTVCRFLDNDRRAVTKAIWLGSGLGMVMTVVWTVAVMAALPMEGNNGANIISAFKLNEPATIPLGKMITSSFFNEVAFGFAIVAMSTAYIATAIALISFIRDLVSGRKVNKWFVAAVAFMPPLLVSIFYPDVFLEALNIVGGVGVGTLFGILPGLLLVKQGGAGSSTRWIGYGIVVFFLVVLSVEVLQEMGMLHISPDVEYWTAHTIRR
ncbi:aromatic amino acid transport family protein [uncultured Pseudodesulfovibrio sp.]|uniref:aromatic amino acid transport family protein n=1 Tax=uncultured Pseudodesulfovibrio sp. TaxID=2035858 RepID=UPI0029C99DFE|nr:aromatic amino acid transport family protein [uncultured Pseudodesulfovibrio sp.]